VSVYVFVYVHVFSLCRKVNRDVAVVACGGSGGKKPGPSLFNRVFTRSSKRLANFQQMYSKYTC